MSTPPLFRVEDFTDKELYEILDMIHPTDRELEIKLLSLIRKYESHPSSQKLADFFHQVYAHFFMEEEEASNSKEGFIGAAAAAGKDKVKKSQPPPPTTNNNNTNTNNNHVISVLNTTQPFSVFPDNSNPLLNQTITRVVSIDSQFRDNLNNKGNILSTDFNFNLSEPLKDVVSLKLYSVQLPFTWYTIDDAFGSNFFVLQPTATNLLNSYQFKIDICAGNYTTTTLFDALNQKIPALQQSYPDVSFGKTSFLYDPVSAKTTININLQNVFTENQYQLNFTHVPLHPNNPSLRTDSIPSFLGFYNSIYPTSSITAEKKYSFVDVSNVSYTVTSENDGFNFIHYLATPTTLDRFTNPTVLRTEIDANISPGAPNYNSTIPPVIEQYRISFSDQIVRGGSYTRNQLLQDLQENQTSFSFLDELNSSFDVTQLPMTSNYADISFCQFRLTPNRYTTQNIPNGKWCIEFPQETSLPYIWCDFSNNGTSCFNFPSSTNFIELNTLLSEEAPAITNYIIDSNPQLVFQCIKEPFNFPQNNLTLTLANSVSSNGYTLTQYIEAINQAIQITNQEQGLHDDFQLLQLISPTLLYQDTSTNYIHLQANIHRDYTFDYFMMNLSKNWLGTLIQPVFQTTTPPITTLDGVYSDLSGNPLLLCQFPLQPNGYTLPLNQPMLHLLLKPQYNGSLTNYIEYVLYYNVITGDQTQGNITFNTADEMLQAINQGMNNFVFTCYRHVASDSGLSSYVYDTPLVGSQFTNLTLEGNQFTCYLEWNIHHTLHTQDYQLVYVDTNTTNSWITNLFFPVNSNSNNNTSTSSLIYSLGTVQDLSTSSYPPVDIRSTTFILSDEITLNDTNNILVIEPLSTTTGLSSTQNTIQLQVPSNIAYQRQDLINLLNTLLRQNPVTVGSYFYVDASNRCHIRLNINQIYTAKDYQVVFYDPIDFVRCYIGASSVRNVSYNSTLGWILGFRANISFPLSVYYNPISGISILIGDTTVVLNLYSYFMIILDDYNQNHLNDGLVTVTKNETSILPYASTVRSPFVCNTNDSPNQINLTNEGIIEHGLTQNQVYSQTQLLNANRQVSTFQTSNGPYIADIFGLLPLKTGGLSPGDSYIEFGGTLQAQERKYFGPVNIHRMHIQLINDHGNIVNLNGQNWSFSFLCEQLYTRFPKE